MTPAPFSLTLYRGDTYAWRFRVWEDVARTDPADLSGVTAAAEIRSAPGGTVLTVLDCTVELPNTILVKFTAAMWTGWRGAKGAWDLQLTWPGGEVTTPVAGAVTVTADVTDSVPLAVALR